MKIYVQYKLPNQTFQGTYKKYDFKIGISGV